MQRNWFDKLDNREDENVAIKRSARDPFLYSNIRVARRKTQRRSTRLMVKRLTEFTNRVSPQNFAFAIRAWNDSTNTADKLANVSHLLSINFGLDSQKIFHEPRNLINSCQLSVSSWEFREE
ncbi:unnamed protein product [Calicophoron daubneyi]|uniref:Reverse transcriptase n=1 Tax=Calicophoron daubneyi TaxID=300641 RepID=A0AAV2T9G1_CALDB